jgi:hypothetical protein
MTSPRQIDGADEDIVPGALGATGLEQPPSSSTEKTTVGKQPSRIIVGLFQR